MRPVGPGLALRLTVVGALVLLFLWGDFELFRRLFRATAQIEALSPFFAIGLIENFLGLVFLVSMMTLFFSAMTTAIGAFFTDADLEIYHAAPLPRLRIVATRWVATMVQSSYLIVFFLIPVLVALTLQYEQSFVFLTVAIVDLILLVSIPVSLAAMIVLFLVRFFPVRGVHQIAASLAILTVSLAIVALRMARPERLFTEVTTDELRAVLSAIELPSAELWPSHWLGRALSSRILEEAPLMPSGRLALLAVVLLAAFLLLASLSYYDAWVRSRESAAPVMLGAGPATRVLEWATARFDPRTRAMFNKEVRTVTRDATQWSQLFMMVALLFIYLYNIQMMPLEGDFRATLLAWLNLGMSGFVISALGLRFAYPSMSAEGRQFWILRTAPVTMRRLLWIKTAVYGLPLMALSVGLTILANYLLDAGPTIWLYTIACSLVMTATLIALGVGLGGISPDFKAENPVKVALSLGGFAYMSLSLLYIGLMMFLFARPVQRFAVKMAFGLEIEQTRWDFWIPVAIGVALSLLLTTVPIELARRALIRRHA